MDMAKAGTLVGDLGFGWRMLRRYPSFAATAILVLAMGIGANAAIFSAVSSVILAPLPFSDSDRLMRIVGTNEFNGEIYQSGVFPRYYEELKRRATSFQAVAAQRYRNMTLTGAGEPERVVGIGVTDGWPEVVGVEPILGRHFSSDELRAGSPAGVILITHALWQRNFGGSDDVLGSDIRLNDRTHSVIGVMPPQFNFPYNTDLWLPLIVEPEVGAPGDLNVPARLRPGVTSEQAIAELNALGASISAELPGDDRRGLTARTFDEEFGRDPDNAIAALSAAVGFVLLLACVNVANLQFARAAMRGREAAIRTTLGATRARQVHQHLTESLLLALIAGMLGTGLAFLASEWLSMLVPARLGEVIQSVRIESGVLLFAAGISVLTALLFGLAPAIRLSSTSPAETLRSGGRFGSGAARLLKPLVVAQVALAFVLLVGAGLMARNFSALMGSDVGYEPTGLYRIGLGLPEPVYHEPARRARTVALVTERLEALPGIDRAGVTSLHPVPGTTSNTGTRAAIPEMPATEDPPIVGARMVSPGYFETVGIPLLAGRGIDRTDTSGSEPVVVVNESFAERFWPGEDAVGQRVRPGDLDDPWHRVVGVVGDIAEPGDGDVEEVIYRPYAQATAEQQAGMWSTTSVDLLVRAESAGDAFLASVSRAVWSVDPRLPLFEAQPMAAVLAEPLEGQRLGTMLFLGFGAFGLFMAALGTYGVIALTVAAHARGHGIRLALGIDPSRLGRIIIGQGMSLVLVGLGIGLLAALLLSPLTASVMTEVDPRDPVMMAAAAGLLATAGLGACWMPAARARRVDPSTVLRED